MKTFRTFPFDFAQGQDDSKDGERKSYNNRNSNGIGYGIGKSDWSGKSGNGNSGCCGLTGS